MIGRRIRPTPQRLTVLLGGRVPARILLEASTESEWAFPIEPNRLNVAVSRAEALAIVVGSPALLAARPGRSRR